MIGNALFSVGLLFSGALVWRGLKASWWRAYPVVFAYFLITFLHAVGGWLVYSLLPNQYATFRWGMESLYIILGFGLIWQVYAAIPQQYPGVGRIVKLVAQGVAAAVPIMLALAVIVSGPRPMTLDMVERNFRVLQAGLILVVLGLALYYSIPLSRNLQALTQGYGLYLAVFLVRYTFWPMKYGGFWQFVMPFAYIGAQLVWLRGLWHYKRPEVDHAVASDADGEHTYESIATLRRQLQTPFLGE